MCQIDAGGDWADCRQKVLWLLHDIVDTYCAMAGREDFPALLVNNRAHGASPLAAYEPCNGRVVIYVATEGTDYWAQITYQLAHELTHVHCNFAAQRGHEFKWLEEALCELASWCTLHRLAEYWQTSDDPKRCGFVTPLRKYLQNIERKTAGTIPKNTALWLDERLPLLRQDPYRREDNAVVANALLPHVSVDFWQAVGHLNLWPVEGGTSLSNYLEDWRIRCPLRFQPAVSDVARTLLK